MILQFSQHIKGRKLERLVMDELQRDLGDINVILLRKSRQGSLLSKIGLSEDADRYGILYR